MIFRRLLPLCLAVVVGCTEPGVTSKDHGNGLRLTIARLLARQHGGDVRLIAREGGGVVTEFTLPCVPPAGGP